MSILLHGDCLEEMKSIDDKSVDLIFCDLPYGQTSCKWDCKIDLDKFWIEIMRIKKLNTPIFFTTTTKFGVDLINSAPKKCFFRYDIVWLKSAPAGFLSAKKMPLRKHEMVYVFYEKLPFYNLSSHTHKFIKANIKNEPTNKKEDDLYGIESGNAGRKKGFHQTSYNPPLPTSVLKEEIAEGQTLGDKGNEYITEKDSKYETCYGDVKIPKHPDKGSRWNPPLPTSVVKEKNYEENTRSNKAGAYGDNVKLPESTGKAGAVWEPPLPTSVVKEEKIVDKNNPIIKKQIEDKNYSKAYKKDCLMGKDFKDFRGGVKIYDPPLPTSVVKEEDKKSEFGDELCKYDVNKNTYGGGKEGRIKVPKDKKYHEAKYDPPLPTSALEIKSTRGKHSTEKPVALMEWILKYYSKEGDVVLDPTMGSGSTGVACNNMNRNFIGIEKDPEIYEVAVNRIEK